MIQNENSCLVSDAYLQATALIRVSKTSSYRINVKGDDAPVKDEREQFARIKLLGESADQPS